MNGMKKSLLDSPSPVLFGLEVLYTPRLRSLGYPGVETANPEKRATSSRRLPATERAEYFLYEQGQVILLARGYSWFGAKPWASYLFQGSSEEKDVEQ